MQVMVKMTDTVPRMPEDLPSSNLTPSQVSSDSSSDFSLVSHPPESNIVNGSFPTIQDFNFGLNNASIDLSFEEMQVSVQRLLQENAELKDVVQQDHATMKNQYELILSSKEQIETFMKQQLQRREQVKGVIDKLQAENDQLKKQLESQGETSVSQNQTEQLGIELEKLKQLCDSKTEENEQQAILYHQLQLEVVELRADLNQLKGSHSHLLAEKRELAAMNAELQAKLSGLQQSPDEFIAASDGSGDGGDQQSFLLVQPKSNAATEKCSQSLKLEEQTIKGLLAQLSLEQNKTQELATELDVEKATVGEMSKQVQGQEEVIRRLVLGNQKDVPEPGADLIAELRASEHKINIANGYIQKYRDRCDMLENEIRTYQDKCETLQAREECTIEKLTTEIKCLKKTLEAEQTQSAEDKNNLQEVQAKLDLVMQDNQHLQHQWEDFSQEQLSKGRQSEAYYCLQMKTLQEKIDMLTANLVNREEAFVARSAELLAAKEELQRLQAEAETVPILQAQVEVYKADFRAERESRESIQAEKEHVLEELRAIKARMSPQSRQGEHVHRSSRRQARQSSNSAINGETMDQSTVSGKPAYPSAPQLHNFGVAASMANNANATIAAVPEENQYICPKCTLKFDSYHPLLNHVNECLDMD